MRVLVLACTFISVAAGARDDDVQSGRNEAEWFHAQDHLEEIRAFLAAKAKNTVRSATLLDLFGASGKLAAVWRANMHMSLSFDIKRDKEEDLTSRQGFFRLLELGLMLLPGALLFAAPPCSFLSA